MPSCGACPDEAACFLLFIASVIEQFEALQLPHVEQQHDRAPDLSFARFLWNSLTGSLFSAEGPVSAAALDEASGHSAVLHFLSQCLQLSEYVDGFNTMVRG